MAIFKTLGLAAVVMAAIVGAMPAPVHAAGALAVGQCDRHGFAYGYGSSGAAQARALAECRANGDGTCQVVVTFRGVCAAFAVGGQCGARGWAYAGSRGGAERLALRYCANYGGGNCSVRRWVCDGG